MSRVAIIQGGPGAEAHVSRASAKGVEDALTERPYATRRFELGPEFPADLVKWQPDVVLPMVHGAQGEDGCLQGLLEIMGVPYVGSGVRACAAAAHKPSAKQRFEAAGLAVAQQTRVLKGTPLAEAAVTIAETFPEGCVIKPASQGSAIGVHFIEPSATRDEIRGALVSVFKLDTEALVEEWLRGHEVTCGVLDIPSERPAWAFRPTLITPKGHDFYNFTSRYGVGASEHQCPAPFSDALNQRISQAALRAHQILGCRHLSRADFVVRPDHESPVVILETNALPGMTSTSLYPEAAAESGVSFGELCHRWVQDALRPSDGPRVTAVALPD